MLNSFPYIITSLGDSALLIDFGNIISEELNNHIVHLCKTLEENPVEGMIEVVPAYSSFAIYYNPLSLRHSIEPGKSVFEKIKMQVEERLLNAKSQSIHSGDFIRIPVCYDARFGFDQQYMEEKTNLSKEEIIEIHTSKIYHVYMLGFLPGFPYMGEVDDQIMVQRKQSPISVPAGSVGIAGKQTGIYPLNSPGGWQIIGRTPVKMFLPERTPPVYLKAGDKVQFYSITYDEFESY